MPVSINLPSIIRLKSRQIQLCCFGVFVFFATALSSQTHDLHVAHRIDRLPVDLQPGEATLRFTGLDVDKSYSIFTNDPESIHFLTAEGQVWMQPRIRISGANPTVVVQVERPSSSYITISCIDCRSPQRETTGARANPIVIENGRTVEDLIRNVFIGGECYDVSNITFSGLGEMFGAFSSGTASIGMNEGIVMSTGDVSSIPGPNDEQGMGSEVFDSAIPEIDLAVLADSNELFDVASIEFDFIPTNDTVSFRYVFASEEYCEYNFSEFNDKFGFFISGPGINGPYSRDAENIATIPGQNVEVSINTVNMSQNGEFYVDNIPQGQEQFGDWDCVPDTAVNGVALDYIEFDGFTVVLTAKIAVEKCETYHIKLVIADQTDPSFDSAVFFEKGSFSSGTNADVNITYTRENDTLLYEGCGEGILRFTRNTFEDIGESAEVAFTFSPMGTAENGVDFAGLVSPIIIPAGDTAVDIPFQIFQDGITEGIETIILIMEDACRCSSSDVVIKIGDLDPLSVSIADESHCSIEDITITPEVINGLEPYTYQWSTNETSSSITVTPTTSTSYIVTVTDVCDDQVIDTVDINLTLIETSISADTIDCGSASAMITTTITNQQPSWTITWQDPDENVLTPASPNAFDVSRPGTYIVTVEDPENNCVHIDSIEVVGIGDIPIVQAGPDTVIGCTPIMLSAATDPTFAVSWNWTKTSGQIISDPQQMTITVDQPGVYIAAATNTESDCIGYDTVVVSAIPLLTFDSTLVAPTCSEPEGTIVFTPTAPSSDFTIQVDNQQGVSGDVFSLMPGAYTFNLITTEGCTTVVPIVIPEVEPLDVRFDPDVLTNLDRGGSVELRPIINVAENALTQILYSPDTFLNSTQILYPIASPLLPITYQIMVTDTNGCVDSATVQLLLNQNVHYYVPNAFSPNDDGINDYFTIFSDETITSIKSLKIFNRWGGKVFDITDIPTNDVSKGWNGIVNSKAASESVFVYYATLSTIYGTEIDIQGEFVLVR